MNKIPCINCGKCSGCPEWIAIPKIFAMYNEYILNGDGEAFKEAYKQLGMSNASVCVCCGHCARQCPQKIEIPDELAKIVKLLETL